MSSEILLAMSSVQAQDESVSLSSNMRWSYQERMKNGNFLGTSSTYGYILIDCATAIINEAEAQIIRMMKDLYLSGWGFQKIADYLNAKGIKTRLGRIWTAIKIRDILTNERYVGDALLQKTITTYENPPRRTWNDGSQPMYYVENCLPAIFSKEDRRAILELLESRKNCDYKKGGHTLSRMLRCADCGNVYRRIKRTDDIVWSCIWRNSKRSNCEYYVVREEDVCQAFINVVNKLYRNKEKIVIPLLTKMELVNSKICGTEQKLKTIDTKIAELSRQSLVISELMKNGILDSVDFYSQFNEISSNLSELRSKRIEILKENDANDTISSLRQLCDLLEDMQSELTDYDEDIIRSVIKYATVISNTELKICGQCGTSYRRSVWSKNGKKKAVWRCISRMDYGKQYCTDSPTIEETLIHDAIVKAINEVANDDNNQLALKNLKTHIKQYYGTLEDNSVYDDEICLNTLIDKVMQMARTEDANNEEFVTLSKEISEVKKRIAEKKQRQSQIATTESRVNEIIDSLNATKSCPIEYDDIATRKLIDCIKVMSKHELLIEFKGGIKKTIMIG